MIPLALSIAGSALSLLGNVLLALKKRSGWIVWILGNIAWILYNVFGDMNIPMVIMYAVYFVLNVFAFVNWSKKNKERN